jgi:uncharacterized membrane protein
MVPSADQWPAGVGEERNRMAEGERDQAQLEQQVADLTRRLSELETRLAQIEGRPASAPGPEQSQWPGPQQWPGQQGPGQQWPGQQWPAPQQWPALQQWGAAQGWVPQQQWGQPPEAAKSPALHLPHQQLEQEPPRPRQQPKPQLPPDRPTTPPLAPRYANGSGDATYRPVPPPAHEMGMSLASLRDLESRLTGRLLAWVGAAAVVLGSVFFLSLAFSRGWIGPEGRVAMGLAGGAAFVAVGAWLFGRRQASLGHVLVAVGLGVVSLSLFSGTRFYNLYPPEAALAGSFVAAVAAAAIAVRVRSEVVAIFGLLAIAAAPPVMGAGANEVTIAFLAVTVVGTTAISLAKSWRWLPPIAFAITAPQLIFWLSARPDAATAVVALAAYWLLHAIAASADELRTPPEARLEEQAARSATLFFLNSALAIGGGLWILSGNLAAWQGAYIAAAALAHFAFGAYFVWRRGDTYPFGLFINAIGVAAVALAIERQFDGPPVAIGWAIEGAVLAAVLGFRRNSYAGWAAAIVGTLAVSHLGVYEYPLLHWSFEGGSRAGHFAFANTSGIALAAVLIAGAVAAWLSRRNDVRLALLITGSFVVAYSLPFELSGPALVAPWAFEAAVLAGVWRLHRNDYLGGTVAVIAAIAVAHFGVYEYQWLNWSLGGVTGSGPFPFADSAGLTLGCLLVAGLVAGLVSRSREVRIGLVVAGSLLVAYSLPYELSGPSLVAGWSAEVVGLAALWGYFRNPYVGSAAGVIGILAVAQFGGYEYSLYLWALNGVAGSGRFAFADAGGVALACLLVAAILIGITSRSHSVRCAMTTCGLLLVGYSLPYELTGVALVAGWAVLLPASIAAEGLLDRLPGAPDTRARLRRIPVVAMVEVHWPDAPLLPALAAGFLAVAHMLAFEMPIATANAIVVPAVPFADLATASAAIGVASFLAASRITARPDLRVGAIVVATALTAYTVLFELALPYAVVAWCLLAIVLGVWSFRPSFSRWTYITAAATLVVAGVITILAVIAPVERLGVHGSVASTGEWFALNSILSIGAVAVAVAAGARFLPLSRPVRSALFLAAGTALVYLASVLLVDFFQGQVGGTTALEELQKQAQVAVSILWALIGMAVFMAGLIGWRQGVREAGLGLLAVATGKVFLFDLSYLDVAYRVLSLIGLGLLLLAGAYAYQSLRPRRTVGGDEPGEAG